MTKFCMQKASTLCQNISCTDVFLNFFLNLKSNNIEIGTHILPDFCSHDILHFYFHFIESEIKNHVQGN